MLLTNPTNQLNLLTNPTHELKLLTLPNLLTNPTNAINLLKLLNFLYIYIYIYGKKKKNTEWAVGVCIYTGNDTRLGRSRRTITAKRSLLDAAIDAVSGLVFTFQASIALLLGLFWLCIRPLLAMY
jgi:hypothetical protein